MESGAALELVFVGRLVVVPAHLYCQSLAYTILLSIRHVQRRTFAFRQR
jgi:hypothetical protein